MEKLEIKNCLYCGKELQKAQLKYCSIECLILKQYTEYINNWKDGKISGMKGKYEVSKRIRKYLLEKYDNKCQLCGWSEINQYTGKVPLLIHHIDGDCLNNTEDNLLLLCPNCHSLTETFGNLNKQSSRIFRKQKCNI